MENSSNTTSVKISQKAKNLLDKISRERGIGKIELVSRAIEWLNSQDKTLQAIVLGQIEEKDAPSVLGLIHKRLAQELTDKYLDIDSTLAEAKELDRKRKKKG